MRKYIILTSLVIILLLTAGNQQSTTYPDIRMPEPGESGPSTGIEFKMNVSDKINSNTMKVYSIVKLDFVALKKDLKDKFAIKEEFVTKDDQMFFADDNIVVNCDLSNGFWTYTNKKIDTSLYENAIPSNLSEERCKEIAQKTAKKYGLDTSIYKKIIITPIECKPADGKSVKIGNIVYFYPEVNGLNVYGVSRFCVALDANGEIASINNYYKMIKPYKDEKIVNVEEAIDLIKANKCTVTGEEDILSATITDYKFGYFDDPSSFDEQPYMQPVIILSGSGVDKDGKESKYEALVPALKKN